MANNKTATIIFKGEDQISPAIKGATASVAGFALGLGKFVVGSEEASSSIRDNLIKQIEAARQKIRDFAKQGLKAEQGQALAELYKLNRELEKLDRPIGGKTFDPLAFSAEKTAQQIKSELIAAIAFLNKELADLSRQKLTPEVQIKQNETLAQLENLKKQLTDIDRIAPRVGVSLQDFLEGNSFKARELATQMQFLSRTLSQIGTTFNDVAQASNKAFLQFDSARVKVGALSKDSQGLALQAKQLVNELGNQATSTEVLAANYQILSSGFTKTADVTNITRASLIGATAGFTDTATVADALTSVLNAYGKSADESNKIIDQFIVTQDRGKTTVNEFAKGLGNVIPIAANAGVSFEEVQGALATLTLQGVKSATAITNIKNVISDISNPSETARRAFEEIGITNAAATLQSEGLVGVLQRIKDAGKDSAEELGAFFGDIRSRSGAAGLLKGDLKAFKEITEDITVRGGKSLKDYTAIADSAEGKLKASVNKINESLVNLGSGVNKALEPVIFAVSEALDVFNLLPEPVKTAFGAVTILAGGFLTLGAALVALGAAAPAFVQGLALLGKAQVALGGATATTTALTAAEAAAFGGVAAASGTATAGVGTLTTATATLGTTAGVTAGTLGLIGLAVASLIPAGAQLAAAFNVSEGSKSLDDLQQKLKEVRAERDKIVAPVEAKKDDGLGQGQGGLIPTRFSGDIFGQQRARQKEVIALAENQKEYDKILEESLQTLQRYGLSSADAGDKARLGASGIAEFTKKANEQKEEIDLVIASLKQQASGAKDNPVLQAQLNNEIAIFAKRKKLLDDRVKFLNEVEKKEATIAKRSSEDIEEAAKKRINAEKRSLEEGARLRAREFDKQAKAESGDFEKQARADQQAFEKSLNAEKKTFDDTQKADREAFEKGLLAEQRTFNDDEKSKDQAYQKTKQDAERAFNAEQQAQKAEFDKRQQDAAKEFDAAQNAEKLAAESQFSQRRLEIERQLQLDAAKTPEDRAKLEADFKAADEKAAREKAAFAQLKKDEEAFALKQQQAKIAFEESQKLAAQTFEANQQAAKLAFDDQIKARDIAFEQQKEAAKLAFEDTLKARRDELEAGQSATKLAFEEQLALKKQAFEDAERAKKDAFELSQNEKKAAFEESERAKKDAFEDNLKALESKFKADERAKDLANAQQVAAIKNATPASAIASKVPALAGIGVKPLATGGRFNAGEQLLVGERGAELVKFNNGGFVNNALDTKQILQSNSTSTMSTAKIEGLLAQLVGKLDRPNIAVTTAENPSDTLVKIQREIGRSLAVGI